MSFNIFDSAKVLFNNELINKASSFLGETPDSTQKAVNAIVPTVVSFLGEKASSTDGLSQVLGLIKNGYHNGGILDSVHNFFGDGGTMLSNGTNLVSNLFGNKTQTITNAISQYAGIKTSSTNSLLGLAVPSIFSLLGKHATNADGTLSENSLGSVLSNQSSWLYKFIPSGFGSVLGTLGLGSLASNIGNTTNNAINSATSTIKNTANNAYNAAEETIEDAKSGGMKFLVPLLLLLLAAAAIIYFWKGCNNPSAAANASDSAQNVTMPGKDSAATSITAVAKGKLDSLSGDFVYDLGNMVTITLPDSAKLTVGEFSTEARLINFLNDKNATIDTVKGNWFEFTNVRFKTGGTEISDSSLAQLKNFAAIAKAFPSAKFKIGGYTDNTGDSSKNVILSDKRANAVLAKSVALGVAKTSLDGAKGYGPLYAIADNATAEGRAQNRRVAVNVKSK